MFKCKYTRAVTKILVLIGALNWGLVGLANFNLVSAIFGEMNLITRVIYILVGVSAAWRIAEWFYCCKNKGCEASKCNSK